MNSITTDTSNCYYPSPTYVPTPFTFTTGAYSLEPFHYKIKKVENGFVLTRDSKEYVASDLKHLFQLIQAFEKND